MPAQPAAGHGYQPNQALTAADEEVIEGGFTLLHDARTEPWGQTVARLQSPEGAVVGISFAPWMHDGT